MSVDYKKPKATNRFASYGMFYNRELYKTESYPDSPGDVQPIDLWYKRGFYGKLDTEGNPVKVVTTFIKNVPSKKSKKVFVLNFVADAFEDLREYMVQAGFQNKIETENTEYYDLQPKLGWDSVEKEFDFYMQVSYDAFFDGYMADKQLDERIVSFSSFVKLFANFVERVTPKFVFTQTGFVGSRFGSPLTSGLMLELSKEPHDIDANKYDKFILDKNFRFFTRAAQQFGFIVDKNAPWRLVADIGSSKMQEYMKTYNLTLKNLFHVAYSPTFQSDIEILKSYLVKFYNAYVTERPEVRINKTIYKRPRVLTANTDDFDNVYWLKYYAFFRGKELHRQWRQVTFDRLIKTATQINKFKSYDFALKYLNKRLKGKQPEFLALTNSATHDKIEFDFLKSSTFQGFRLL
jgi:hypothetical protein